MNNFELCKCIYLFVNFFLGQPRRGEEYSIQQLMLQLIYVTFLLFSNLLMESRKKWHCFYLWLCQIKHIVCDSPTLQLFISSVVQITCKMICCWQPWKFPFLGCVKGNLWGLVFNNLCKLPSDIHPNIQSPFQFPYSIL